MIRISFEEVESDYTVLTHTIFSVNLEVKNSDLVLNELLALLIAHYNTDESKNFLIEAFAKLKKT